MLVGFFFSLPTLRNAKEDDNKQKEARTRGYVGAGGLDSWLVSFFPF